MQNSKLKIQNLLIILFYVLCSVFYVFPVRAISPTSTPTPTLTVVPTEAPDNSIEEKIQQIREEVKKKVREKIEETKKGVKAAYFGEIIDILESEFSLNTSLGEITVKVATDTAIIKGNQKNLKITDFKISDFVISLGYLADEKTLEASRIVVTGKPKPIALEVAFGKVSDISADEKMLTVKNEKRGLIYTVEVTDKTIITKKMDPSTSSGQVSIKKVKFTDIIKGDRLVVIGTPTENEEKIITAKIIHVIPSPTPTE